MLRFWNLDMSDRREISRKLKLIGPARRIYRSPSGSVGRC